MVGFYDAFKVKVNYNKAAADLESLEKNAIWV